MQVALQERKPPTKEEIAAKQRNFNIIFWGTYFVCVCVCVCVRERERDALK